MKSVEKKLKELDEAYELAIRICGELAYDFIKLKNSNKSEHNVIKRQILTYAMRKNGVPLIIIAELLDCSHCTLVYSEKTISNILANRHDVDVEVFRAVHHLKVQGII